MFRRKLLEGDWFTDTLDGRTPSLSGNRYGQVFANKGYFACIYPMDSKSKAGDALKTFCTEFGVPDKLTFDGSKEQTGKGTEFMRQIRRNDINFHVIEPELHNQNPAEGVIREIRRKWFRIMVRKRVPRKLWDYGMRWVCEVMNITYTTAGSMDGCIPQEKVTGETCDISEYLDFGFYDKVWFHDNAGLGPQRAGRWLGVSHRVGNLMCYWVLTESGSVISRSSVQRVTNLETQTDEVIETFKDLDEKIKAHYNHNLNGAEGSKPNPEDWADFIENDKDFYEEFQKVYNNEDIPEADDYTPEIGDDTYLQMVMARNLQE